MQPPGKSVTRRFVRIGLVLASTAVTPIAAAAQTTPKPTSQQKPPSKQPPGPRWEVSFHGGFTTGGGTPDGTSSTPAPGPTFVMADGATPTRAVASWYFGDGAALLNQVLQLRGVNARLDPLDQPPGWPVPSQSGAEIGARIARQVARGLWVEGAVDVGLAPLGFDDATRDRVEAVRADFETAFTALAASAASIITASTVASSADLASGGRRLLVSGVVQYRGGGRVTRPIVLGGLGVASPVGSPATLTFTGTYRFTTPSQAVIEETDTIRLRYETSNTLVWIFGGGVMRDLSRSSAFRVEVRLLASSTKLTAQLDAAPSRVTASPGQALVLNATNPGLQFSASTAIAPTLSWAQTGFEAFTAEGGTVQLVISASYVRRF